MLGDNRGTMPQHSPGYIQSRFTLQLTGPGMA